MEGAILDCVTDERKVNEHMKYKCVGNQMKEQTDYDNWLSFDKFAQLHAR